jgi:hypothetical protein
MLFMRIYRTLVTSALGVALMWSAALGAQVQVAPASRSGAAHSLKAIRKGNTVHLVWQQGLKVADRQSGERQLVRARICRRISSTLSAPETRATACGDSVGEVVLRKGAAPLTNAAYRDNNREVAMRYVDQLPVNLQESDSLKFAVYTVEVFDDHGRGAGFSNPAPVLLSPTPKVNGLHSELDARGIYLIWEDEIEVHPGEMEFDYRVERREKGSSRRVTVPYLRAVVHQKEGDRWSAVDTGLEWGKTYIYEITPIAKARTQDSQSFAEMEGDGATLEVTAHDVFPPAVPESLLALVGRIPGKKFVDLTWAPNVKKDLATYNVYRREAGTALVRIYTGPSAILSFQDNDVTGGHNYFYCVSAVGANGNESAKSSEVAASVP